MLYRIYNKGYCLYRTKSLAKAEAWLERVNGLGSGRDLSITTKKAPVTKVKSVRVLPYTDEVEYAQDYYGGK